MRPTRNRLAAWSAVAVPIAMSGCVRVQQGPSESVFTMEPRFLIFLSLVAWGAAFLGWMARRNRREIGTLLMIAGGVVLVMTLPGLVASWVRVSDDRVEWRRGLVSRVYRFGDLEQIESLRLADRPDSRGEADHALIFHRKTGEIDLVRCDLSNPLMRAAVSEIVGRARRNGVPINPTGRPAGASLIDE